MGSKKGSLGVWKASQGSGGPVRGLDSQSGGLEGYGAKKRRNEEMVYKLLCARFYGLCSCDLLLSSTDRKGIVPFRM